MNDADKKSVEAALALCILTDLMETHRIPKEKHTSVLKLASEIVDSVKEDCSPELILEYLAEKYNVTP